MIVGTLRLHVHVPETMNLKDKRRVIKSMKDRIRNQFNVSVAEVADQDKIRSCVLGLALATNESRFADSVLTKIVNYVSRSGRMRLIDYEIEIF